MCNSGEAANDGVDDYSACPVPQDWDRRLPSASGDRIGVKDMCADEEVTMSPGVISNRTH